MTMRRDGPERKSSHRGAQERKAIDHRLYQNTNVEKVWWDDKVCTALYWWIAPTTGA